MKVTVKLEKIKVELSKYEMAVLFAYIEQHITQNRQSQFEVAFIDCAWIGLLKEVAVLLMDKDFKNDNDPNNEYTVSLRESQYMALLELYSAGYPSQALQFTGNVIYGKLYKIGIDRNLLQVDRYNNVTPLLNHSINLLNP